KDDLASAADPRAPAILGGAPRKPTGSFEEMRFTCRGGRAQLGPVLALSVVMGMPVAAWAAGPSMEDQATAEALFREARALMLSGKFGDACPKLAESQRLDPGGGTQLLLAQCYEHEGLLASAWLVYSDAIASSRSANRADREKLAREHLAALE